MRSTNVLTYLLTYLLIFCWLFSPVPSVPFFSFLFPLFFSTFPLFPLPRSGFHRKCVCGRAPAANAFLVYGYLEPKERVCGSKSRLISVKRHLEINANVVVSEPTVSLCYRLIAIKFYVIIIHFYFWVS